MSGESVMKSFQRNVTHVYPKCKNRSMLLILVVFPENGPFFMRGFVAFILVIKAM